MYDRLNSWGGAERVLLSLRELYPQAVLFTSVYDQKNAHWAKDFTIRTSFLQRWTWLRDKHRWLGWLMPLAFETLDLSEFELVISVTSEAAKGVITKPGQLHVCYLLTPTRYLWSHQEEYRNSLPILLRPVVKPIQQLLQKWDVVASQRPDYVIPISRAVEKRVKKYYQRAGEEPLYPGYSLLPAAKKPRYAPSSPFLFAWGRHVEYKRFDVVIEAAHRLNKQLIIAGTGPETARLLELADREKVEFVGQVTDAELSWYLQQAECAVFPQLEDFGIAPLEALSQGCPVIVHRESGVAELLQEGKDGIFLSQTSTNAVVQAIQDIQAKSWSRLDIQSRARQYAEESFQSNWKKKIHMLWRQHQQQLKG